MERIEVSPDALAHLVPALVDFAMGMVRTFIIHQDNIPREVAVDFDYEIRAWVARVGEHFPIEDLIKEILDEEEARHEA